MGLRVCVWECRECRISIPPAATDAATAASATGGGSGGRSGDRGDYAPRGVLSLCLLQSILAFAASAAKSGDRGDYAPRPSVTRAAGIAREGGRIRREGGGRGEGSPGRGALLGSVVYSRIAREGLLPQGGGGGQGLFPLERGEGRWGGGLRTTETTEAVSVAPAGNNFRIFHHARGVGRGAAADHGDDKGQRVVLDHVPHKHLPRRAVCGAVVRGCGGACPGVGLGPGLEPC